MIALKIRQQRLFSLISKKIARVPNKITIMGQTHAHVHIHNSCRSSELYHPIQVISLALIIISELEVFLVNYSLCTHPGICSCNVAKFISWASPNDVYTSSIYMLQLWDLIIVYYFSVSFFVLISCN